MKALVQPDPYPAKTSTVILFDEEVECILRRCEYVQAKPNDICYGKRGATLSVEIPLEEVIISDDDFYKQTED